MIGLTRGMSPFTATLPALFAKTSIIYHPCIYVYKNKQLRTVLQRTLRCLYKNKRHPRHGLVKKMCNVKVLKPIITANVIHFTHTHTHTHQYWIKFSTTEDVVFM
jgi:hypothetical protein